MAKRTGLQARSNTIKAASMAMVGESGKKKSSAPDADRDRLIGLSVRLEPDTHETLRKIAFEQRVSIHSLMLEGINGVITRYQ